MFANETASKFDQPWKWLVVFHTEARTSLINRFVPGRFKHVSAVGWSARTGVWVFYDPAADKTSILTANDDEEGLRIMSDWIAGACVVQMPLGLGSFRRWRLGFWCVPAIAHLLGIRSGAVLPSTLLRHCLEQGGRIIQHESEAAQAGPDPVGDGSTVERDGSSVDPEDDHG